MMSLCHRSKQRSPMEEFQAGVECVGRKTPSGGNFGILAFADHLHAQKPI